MPKFRARPKEIEAILVQGPSDLPKGLCFHLNDDLMVWNNLHGKWVAFSPPCWINITTPNDLYPIHPDFMTANYEQLDVN